LGGGRLAGERVAQRAVRADRGVEQLDRDGGTVLGLAEVDDPLATRADAPGQPVRPEPGRVGGVQGLGVRHEVSVTKTIAFADTLRTTTVTLRAQISANHPGAAS